MEDIREAVSISKNSNSSSRFLFLLFSVVYFLSWKASSSRLYAVFNSSLFLFFMISLLLDYFFTNTKASDFPSPNFDSSFFRRDTSFRATTRSLLSSRLSNGVLIGTNEIALFAHSLARQPTWILILTDLIQSAVALRKESQSTQGFRFEQQCCSFALLSATRRRSYRILFLSQET